MTSTVAAGTERETVEEEAEKSVTEAEIGSAKGVILVRRTTSMSRDLSRVKAYLDEARFDMRADRFLHSSQAN